MRPYQEVERPLEEYEPAGTELSKAASSAGKLRVSEIFESVQGEGVNIGMPSTFLRLALCNLRCTWCDTKYTWDWQNYKFEEEVQFMSQQEIIDRVRAKRSKNIVVTGGEPLLQQRQLAAILRNLAADHTFEVETAGTIVPSDGLVELVKIWNVSPKLANSGNSLQSRHREHALAAFAQLENAFFKFVIESENDIQEVLSLVDEFHIANRRVLLMPEATDGPELDKKSEWLTRLCIQYQFRLGYRLHVALWGNRRGV